ncbi:ATP-dependent zinc metalloprotease FtsH [Patescibacteria group bacterium]|nr:ATP-dependent zinc metalloprotease FtsH [Patescibacteria group bacterium]
MKKLSKNILWVITFLFLIAFIFSLLLEIKSSEKEILTIDQLVTKINTGEIKKITVNGNELKIVLSNDIQAVSRKESETSLTETFNNYGVNIDALQAVTFEIQDQSGLRYWLGILIPTLGPLIIIILIFWWIFRRAKTGVNQAFSFGKMNARLFAPTKNRITFKEVAGLKEAKEELKEIVDFLKHPKKFLEIGARIPRGVLLVGPPGTGKTLLARAISGEAKVPFFTISGSEFVEMFVGVGASRVRDLFKTAKQAAPSIIFVDEIDAVGRVRGSGVGGGNDEREQTLNQILVEMDGFETNEKVIVMAATNRPDVLDPALLRPGRFDRRVTIDIPDRQGREDILKIHARKKPLAEDVNLKVVAQRTPGFTGADLASLMNEGAILAAREERKKVSQFELVRSIEKVMLGPERKSHVLSAREKKITAYHEAGHALISSLLPYADPVHKISIIARGRAAGYTLHLPFEDKRMQSMKEFKDDIAVSLGGYVAERLVFDDLTTGPSNDLQVLTALARSMVTKYGMSEKMGPIALEGEGGRALFGTGVEGKEYSQKVSADIDAEVEQIINEAYKKAEKILTEHRGALDAIANKLIEVESLEREEFEKVLIANGITPKKPEESDSKMDDTHVTAG